MSTSENLKAAFAGESQANRKYLAFAKKADGESFPFIAKLFRAAAEAETIHAHAHLKNMAGINGTLDNLQAAIEGEGYEFKSMYPEFLAEAEKEGNKAAANYFKFALAAEKVHYDLYNRALNAIQGGKDFEACEIYVCPVCGHTHIGKPSEKCPICGVAAERYFEVK